jgi:hypothetical protein
MALLYRRDARVVDWGGLENRCPGNWTGGSNPFLSADHINTVSPPNCGLTGFLFYGSPNRACPEVGSPPVIQPILCRARNDRKIFIYLPALKPAVAGEKSLRVA